MESELTTTFSRGITATRDHSAPRRAYLDTYAKRRAGASVQEISNSGNVAQSLPIQSVQKNEVKHSAPTVVAVPIQTQTQTTPNYSNQDFITEQPAVDNFSYRATAPVIKSTPPKNTPQKSYLDTLMQRHTDAVAGAPLAIETVFEPTTNETDTLFEDPEKEARLEANLRALYSDDSLIQTISANTKSASAAHVRTIVASAFMCGVMAVGIFTFLGKYDSQPVIAQPIGSPVIEVEASAATPINAPAITNQVAPIVSEASQPVRIVISGIGVNAPVEALGTTPEGLIAVPNAYGVVGWYNKSAVPGKAGPSVLVGHNTGNNNGVFDNLKNLKNGDLITTTNSRGQNATYRVTAMNEYEKDKVPMAELFKSSKESRLEIITCSGKWRANNYTNRIVVTAELVK